METIQTDRTRNGAACIASIIAASLLILGGLALLVYYLTAADGMFSIPVWQFSLYALSPVVPVVAGGMWINTMYRRGKTGARQWVGGGLALGLMLILVGVFMLGFATDSINMAWRPVFISWQMLVIVIGVFEMCKRRGHIAGGLVAIMAGYFFLIPRIARIFPGLIELPDNFISIYWPALFIAGGAAIIIGMITRPKWLKTGSPNRCFGESGRKSDYTSEDKSGMVKYDLIFGGTDQVFLDPEFNGGEINVIFGGVKLDLRNTKLPSHDVFLKISTIFGGVEILAPNDWDIELKSGALFGGFVDNRRKVVSHDENRGRLIMNTSCVFGGGEIK